MKNISIEISKDSVLMFENEKSSMDKFVENV